VLSALARATGADRSIQQQLYHARTPAHAYELLHLEEQEAEFEQVFTAEA
jgi:hypothetical protein